MPLPTPNKGEKKSDFISRCVTSKVMQTEYPDKKQRLAVCYSQWNRKNKKEQDYDGEGGECNMAVKAKKIPRTSLQLLSGGADAFALTDKDGKKRLEMTVYSGKVIPNHWYWGNLAIDLDGGVFSQSKYPVLEDHNTSKKIAFSKKPIIDGAIKLNPETTEFVDTPESEEFQRLSSQGFPYQASVYATPLSVEWVKAGESVKVNGYKLHGPGAVWRQWRYNEASVCVFGADAKTSSKAFSDQVDEVRMSESGSREEVIISDTGFDGVGIKKEGKEKEVSKKMKMTVDKFKEEYPDVYEEVVKMAEKHTKDFEDGISKLTETVDALNKKVEELSKENEGMRSENASLRKEVDIAKEKALKADAENHFDSILAEKEVPDRFHSKIKTQVSYNDYVDKETGVLDMEKFTEAINAEVDSWAELFSGEPVKGGGTIGRTASDSRAKLAKKEKEENEKLTSNLLSMVGYDVEE